MALVNSVKDTLTSNFKGVVVENKTPAETLERDERLSSSIAPGCVDFSNQKYFLVDDRYRKAFGLRNFSTLNKAGWGSTIFNYPGIRTSIKIKPSDPEKLRKSINHTDARAGVNLVSGGSATKNMENQLDRDHARTMSSLLQDQKKPFVNCSFTMQIEDSNVESLEANYKHIKDTAIPQGITLDPAVNAQENAFRMCNPLSSFEDSFLYGRFQIDMPLDTLCAMEPFASPGLLDTKGTVLGMNIADSSLIRLNMLETSSKRANMNGILTGSSGKGKSRTLKKIVMSEYAHGARVIALDPEQELKTLCRKLSGQYINAAGQARKGQITASQNDAMLCPLQPRVLNFEYTDDNAMLNENSVVSVLRSTINFVRGFYQLAFGIKTAELPYLDRALKIAYKKHGLTLDTAYEDVDFENYPSFDELAEVFAALAAKEKNPNKAAIYDNLYEQTLTGGSGGLFGNLWSGRTNISLHSDFIVFDINALLTGGVSSAVRNAQMYSILTFVWSEICRSRVTGRPIRLVIDEIHMLFSSDTDTSDDSVKASPISASFVAMIARRARKYNCGLMCATQRLEDMTGPEVAKHGKALIDNSTYQFLFGATDVKPIETLFEIPHEKAKKLQSYDRGRCILRAGNAITEAQIEADSREDAWIGKAGGK